MSSWMKALDSFSLILLNHLITASVFFHWLTFRMDRSSVLMPSRIDLLIFPSSLFVGFINRQVGFARKSSLWSFIVMKACAFPRQLILSSNSSFSAISFASKLISCSIISDAFL